MEYEKLRKLKNKLFFTIEDLAYIFKIKPSSAKVMCSRYVKKEIFIRIKNNFYILRDKWENLSTTDFFRLANFLQVPSYISFMSGLSFYEVTTQVQRNFFESAAVRRSVRFEAEEAVFNFYKLKKNLYFDFIKDNNIFIATKEKAFIDSVYLYSFGKYKLDIDSIDFDKLNKERIKKIIKVYPQKTKVIIKKLCKI